MRIATYVKVTCLAARRINAAPRVRVIAAVVLVACAAGCRADVRTVPSSGILRIGARGLGEAPRVLRESLFAEPLLVLDWQGRLVDRLAESWEWSPDGLALSIVLRDGVRFHDGTLLTSQIVATILREEVPKDPRGFEAVDRLETPDDRTVVFRLSKPDAFLTSVLAGTLIIDTDKPDIGTGPFQIVSRTPVVEAKKNAGYYRGTPGLDRLELITFETQRAAWVALMRGDVDMVQELNPESVEFLEGASGIALYSSVRPFYIPLVFNLRHPLLGRPAVRRALVEAINREEIVKDAMRGQGQVADDPVWPSHWAYNVAARRHPFNPSVAALRLDTAGLPVRPAAQGMASRFEIKCLFWSEDPQFERIALLLQRQLGQIGVNLILIPATQATIRERAGKGDFETYLFQMTSGRSFDWTYRFWHSAPAGLSEFQNSGYTGVDAVLDRLRTSRTDVDVRAAVADLRERFYEDVPAVFLAWTKGTRAVDARYDVGDRSNTEIWAELWRWRLGSRQRAAR